MGYLEKEFILHETDENGNILPIDYPCPELGGIILRVLPASRGRLLRLSLDVKASVDKEDTTKVFAEFAAEHIIDIKTKKPMFTTNELLKSKQIRYRNNEEYKIYEAWDLFISIIYKISGVDIEVGKIEALDKAEDELKKKVKK